MKLIETHFYKIFFIFFIFFIMSFLKKLRLTICFFYSNFITNLITIFVKMF